ncbi:hemerythrin domain-containing protein [Nocardia terrae]|nr:hemerythrin domain-containing protein [Nocardia terrae]
MSTMGRTEHVDTRDMKAVHAGLLREFGGLPDLVTTASTERVPAVAGHARLLLDILEHHHSGEDRLLLPKLVERCGAQLTESLGTAERQHREIHAGIENAEAALARWERQPTAEAARPLAAHLRDLHRALAEHLETEERELLPLAARHLTPAEWHELGASGAAALPKRLAPMVFGMLTADAPPDVTALMLTAVPAAPRLLLRLTATRSYARYRRRILGPVA